MLTDEERDAAIDQAVADAAETIDDATDDQVERDRMWQLLAGGVLISVIAEADEAGRQSIVERLNTGLAGEDVPYRLVRAEC